MLGRLKKGLSQVFRRAAAGDSPPDSVKAAAPALSAASAPIAQYVPPDPALSAPPAPTLRQSWDVISPYFVSSPEKWKARLLLGGVVGLTVGLVGAEVLLNEWSNHFFTQIQDLIKDPSGSHAGIYWSLGEYAAVASGLLGMNAVRQNMQANLHLNWRRWMTEEYVSKWMQDRAHLRLQIHEKPSENPDSRVFDDINQMTGDVITLGSGFLNATATFPAFAFVLWQLSGNVSFNLMGHNVNIPGFLMFGAIAYATLGTWAARKVGRPLIAMHFNQKKFENMFRNNADHIRNNAESIALYNGEDAEKRALRGRIGRITENWHRINGKETQLTVIRDAYNRAGYVMPYMLMLPNVFRGATKWGDLAQAAHAMGQVQSALSWLFYSYSSIARIQAMVSRISTFDKAVVEARRTEISRYPDRSGGQQLELGL